MKYYIIAGEASGDMHASNLMHELNQLDVDAEYRCWGGDLMEAEGGEIVKHYRDLAFMGFAEVLMNIRTITRNISFCKKDIVNYKPDVLILVDYPGFNLRIAAFAKAQGIKVYYYISPQIWAWKKSRVHQIKRNIDKVFCILPFEQDFYAKYDYHADFVGHPLLDELRKHHAKALEKSPEITNILARDSRPIIALLPGSRKQEITKMLPVMVSVTEAFPQYQFVVAGVKWQPEELYRSLMPKNPLPIVWGVTYALLQQSYAALVTSGTATLETALFNIPQVVLYQANSVSYVIAKQLIKDISYISLPNLIMDKLVVTELIQHECNQQRVIEELQKITIDEVSRNQMLDDYKKLVEILGNGNASLKTAKIVYDSMLNNK
jgi:lipid-A-disaccharide synthase